MSKAFGFGHFYYGSRIFSSVADKVGLPVDQFNFVFGQVVAVGLAWVLRVHLHPRRVSTQVRHAYSFLVGLGLLYFCFGYQLLHTLSLALSSYAAMRFGDPRWMQRVVMVIALAYLSMVHIMRQVYDYGSCTLDVTGPMMVITQKVTSLAFSVHDGMAGDKLNPDQQKQAVREVPSLLVYLSFIFHFQTLMCGPLVFYTDYIDFINGDNYSKVHNVGADGTTGLKAVNEPSPGMAVCRKMAASGGCAFILLYLPALFPLSRLTDDEFLNDTSIVFKMFYMYVATSAVRAKYYHAWLLADAISNSSGLGFTGYDHNGKPQWDGLSNVDILGYELAGSFRNTLESWNKSTMVWLRRVAYDRAPLQKTLLTYMLSAVWHGFYPGYYVTFLGGAVFTMAGRSARRIIRPYFQINTTLARIYDVITFIATKAVMGYIVFPFLLLEFWSILNIYTRVYFCLHIGGVLAIFVLPLVIPIKRLPSKSDEVPKAHDNHEKMQNNHLEGNHLKVQ